MSSSDIEKTKSSDKKKFKEEKQPTKVVVRRLPPAMTLESFLEQVDLPAYDYINHVAPDKTLLPNCFSRVYINFQNIDDLFIFTQKFDGYVFLDTKGHEYPAVVEFSPFQRVPKQKSSSKKKDTKCGTIEIDPYYIEFKAKLLEEREKAGNRTFKQHYFETTTDSNEKNKITDTPLLQYLRNKNAERAKYREDRKEERKRKEAERKKMKEELNQRRSHNRKSEQEAYNAMFGGGGAGTFGSRRDQYGRKKDDWKSKFDKPKPSSASNKTNEKTTAIVNKEEKKIIKEEFKDPAIIEARISGNNIKSNVIGKPKETTDNKKFDKRNKMYKEERKTYGKQKETYRDKYTKYKNEYDKGKYDKNKSKGKIENNNQYKNDKIINRPTDTKILNKTNDSQKKKEEKTVNKEKETGLINKSNGQQSSKTNDNKSNENSTKNNELAVRGNNAVSSNKSEVFEEKHKQRDTLQRTKSFEDKQKKREPKDVGRRNSLDSGDQNGDHNDKDPRTERRIRNKDRPAMEIYRPGMGRFSKQRIEREKVGSSTENDSKSTSPSPTHKKVTPT